jgi:hypothetical protein
MHGDEDKGEDGGWKLAFGGESENDQLMPRRKERFYSAYLISRTMSASVWLQVSDVRKLDGGRGWAYLQPVLDLSKPKEIRAVMITSARAVAAGYNQFLT